MKKLILLLMLGMIVASCQYNKEQVKDSLNEGDSSSLAYWFKDKDSIDHQLLCVAEYLIAT